jgi:hypothetical protein
MSENAQNRGEPEREYPLETEGSKLARALREECNSLTEEERERHFAAAMVMIYGGQLPKQEPRAGH